MKTEPIKFDRLSIMNRWKQHKYSRNCSWVILGFQVWWSGPESFCYKICLFGIDFQFWFKKIFN